MKAVLARVARLLHDDVSQVLSAVGLQLDAMRMDFREQTPGIDERAAEIQCMLEQAIEQLRDISNELNLRLSSERDCSSPWSVWPAKSERVLTVRCACSSIPPLTSQLRSLPLSTRLLNAPWIMLWRGPDAR